MIGASEASLRVDKDRSSIDMSSRRYGLHDHQQLAATSDVTSAILLLVTG